jgi:hypothetical protein
VAALGELPWRRHGRSLSAKPISRYGALSWTGFLPTGVVRFGELTWRGGGSSADVVLRSRVHGSEAQALIFGDGGRELQGAAHSEAGQNGCNASCRSSTSGCWSLRSFSRDAAMERAT